MDPIKAMYAREFGLPPEQIRFFDELSEDQRKQVFWSFNINRPSFYVYAVKRDGNLVWERKARDFLREANHNEMQRKEQSL